MWELLHIAAGMNLPIVMPLVNRALSAPINIHGDHSDGTGARDTGWVRLWSENAQEAYDNTIMADSFGGYGPIFMEISSALYQADGRKTKLINKIYGLGGRDYMPHDARQVLMELHEIAKGAPVKAVKEYIGVRE